MTSPLNGPQPIRHLSAVLSVALALVGTSGAPDAHADTALAVEKGCLSCHGDPPRGKVLTLAVLAQRYAGLGDEELARQAECLCEHRLFGGIAAHERLTPQESLRLVRWIAAGAR